MTTDTRTHTPGPWHANTALEERYNESVNIREPVNGDVVAIVSGGANARLIAAAPDLYHALITAHAGLGHADIEECQCSAGRAYRLATGE